MKNNYSIQKDNIPRFLEQISDALMFGNIENSEYIIKKIKKINTYGDACLLLNDDIASNWVPAIINGFFGRECYRKCDLNVDDNKTFLLITPCFLEFENLIIEELQKTIDKLSKELRILDNLLQENNWKTELIEK